MLVDVTVGVFWDPVEVERTLETQFSSLVGDEGGRAIREMLTNAERPGAGNIAATATCQ